MAVKPRVSKSNRRSRTRRPSRTSTRTPRTTPSLSSASQAAQSTEHVPSVEERLRVCLILIGGVYQFDGLAYAQEHVQFDGIEAKDLRDQIPRLAEALREQVLAVRDALPFECMNHEAPSHMPRPNEPVWTEAEIRQLAGLRARRAHMKSKGGAQ